MPTEEHGFARAVTEIVFGFVTSYIVSTFVNSGMLDSSFLSLFHLLNVVFIISLLLKMKYWGTAYLGGWLIGLIIMSPSRLIGTFELFIYLAIPIFVIIIRKLRTKF